MKRTFIDRVVGFFSPVAEQRRLQAKMVNEMMRSYDIAKTFPQADWVSSTASDANSEVKGAIGPGREKVRSLVQNNPYALKAINVIVNETVGSGIVPNIQGRNKSETKLLQKLWNKWADSTDCDYFGQQNFYALQAEVLRSTVQSGEGLVIKTLREDGPKLKQLESDYIDTVKDENGIIQGIELDSSERRIKFWLFDKHPGSKFSDAKSKPIDARNVLHIYRKDRPGQQRGVTWAHAVVEKLKDFDDYQYASLVRQKIAACFAAFVTTPDSGGGLTPSQLKTKRQAEWDIQPNTVRYLNPGEDIKLSNPPAVDGYDSFTRETLRSIANGFGISYESLSGDYSQSNYSSSRMGHLQMRKNIETWRWNIIIPQFCDPAMKMFLEWVQLSTGINPESVIVEWVPPAYTMIDPSKEIDSLKTEVRSGFKSYGQAVLELGQDPVRVLEDLKKWNAEFDAAKVVLDIDPRKMSQQGLVQSTNPVAVDVSQPEGTEVTNDQNKKDASGQPN